MSVRGVSPDTIATAVGKSRRAIGYWTSENSPTVPSERDRELLRSLLGPYDILGDEVEIALANSELTEDRRYEVLAVYKRLLRQQAAELAG